MSPARTQAAEDAIKWMLALENNEMGDIEHRKELVAWLKSSAMHVDEFLHALSLHDALRSLPGLPDIEQLINEVRGVVVSIPNQSKPYRAARGDMEMERVVNASVANANTGRRFSDWRRFAATAATLLVVAASLWLALPSDSVYRTLSGETRSITLMDGSRIHLGGRSEVRIRITDASRLAEVMRGEILFAVEPNPGKPFTVDAGELTIDVVGTRFSVRREILVDAKRTELTVIEGRVNVESTLNASRAAPPGTADDLIYTVAYQASEHDEPTRAFSISGGDQILVTNDADTRKTMLIAKIEGGVEFMNTPLSQVVEVFNQEAGQRLVVVTPSLASRKISTTLLNRNSKALLNFIKLQAGVRITEHGNTIYIHEGSLPSEAPILNAP